MPHQYKYPKHLPTISSKMAIPWLHAAHTRSATDEVKKRTVALTFKFTILAKQHIHTSPFPSI